LSASLLGSGIRPVLVSPAVLPFGQVPITVPRRRRILTSRQSQLPRLTPSSRAPPPASSVRR
jgi:hypothetical protein